MILKTGQTCAACGEGALRTLTYAMGVEHRGVSGEIRQVKLRCDHCKADLFDDECGKKNRRALVQFQKEIEGIPTGHQIRTLRLQLGLTSEQAGVMLGGGPKAFSKYENDEIIPTGAMRTMINFLIKHPSRIDEVLEANGLPPVKVQPATTQKVFAAEKDIDVHVHRLMASVFDATTGQAVMEAMPHKVVAVHGNAAGSAEALGLSGAAWEDIAGWRSMHTVAVPLHIFYPTSGAIEGQFGDDVLVTDWDLLASGAAAR